VANTYQSILDANLNLVPTRRETRAATGNALSTSPGGRTMLTCTQNGWNPVPRYLANIVNALHEELKRANWQWNPSQPGGADARTVLDGTRTSGECKWLAGALRALLVAPPPYGFGLNKNDVSIVEYTGAHGDGFIAEHDVKPRGWFGLQPNVYSPQYHGYLNLYYWPNHKVVKYGHAYLDVCYNKVYQSLDAMAEAHLSPLRSSMKNGSFIGEHRSRSADPEYDGKYWRLPSPTTGQLAPQCRLEGPYGGSLY
jgi:hypothetical protein